MEQDGLKVGLIGCGASRKMYGRALGYIRGVVLTAVADPDVERRETALEEMGARRGYKTAEEMLSQEKLNAVLIASPVFCHEEHVVAAAQAGVSALVEKPMARTVAEAERMIAACEKAKILLAVGFQRRWLPPLWTAGKMIERGELGEVFHVECIWTSWSMVGSGSWRDSSACLGGVFQDHGSHTIDLAQCWLGPVHSCSALAHGIGKNLGRGREVEDHMVAIMRHDGGGTSLHEHSRDSHRPVSEFYRIYGTKCMLELEYTGEWAALAEDSWEMRLYKEGSKIPKRLVARRPDNDLLDELSDGHYSFYRELKSFFDGVRRRDATGVPLGGEGLSVVKVLAASFLSTAEGRVVTTSEGYKFDDRVFDKLLKSFPGD